MHPQYSLTTIGLFYAIPITKFTKGNFIETNTAFSHFNLNENLLKSLHDKGFQNASAIQELTIPEILNGKDIFAQAETGSGKTGSFAIPILELILRSGTSQDLYIVLSPTRELAQQTHKVFCDFATPLGIEVGCFIGGESFDRQKKVLSSNPQILVATPGRFTDLLRQKLINLEHCTGVVFDEADRLFDMGFKKDIEYVLNKVKNDRQLIMVSATSNQDVLRTAYHYRSHPVELKLNADDLLVEKINHEVAMIGQEEKMPFLVHLLRQNLDAYAIIFCNTQFTTHQVAIWLEQMNFKAEAISGRMPQNKRTKLMEDFRNKEVTILVCTDVAARGLDIKDVNLVVNYDLPSEAANYVHRIGRTGRAGKEGRAVSFCAFEDCENLDDISKYIGASIPKTDIEDEHFATDICKRPYLDSKTLKVVDRNKKSPKAQQHTKNKRDDRPSDKRAERGAPEKREQKVFEEKFKFFETTTYGLEQAKLAAKKYFGLESDELLEYAAKVVGPKKYILFGPSKTHYKFHVKAFYRKLLLPFYIGLFRRLDLKVYVKVSFRDNVIRVGFSGKDAQELTQNKFALMNSCEQLGRTFLEKRIYLGRHIKFNMVVEKDDDRGLSEDKLIELAKRTMKKVKDSNKAQTLSGLDPAQRRIVHQCINDNEGFESTSIGTGRIKKLKISLT